VPVIWDEQEKETLRRILHSVGIVRDPNNKSEKYFMMISEADAAAVACNKLMGEQPQDICLKEGDVSVIVDAGGGTTDISCLKVTNGVLRELTIQSGIRIGSKNLDKKFLEVFEHMFAIDKTSIDELVYLDLMRHWDTCKAAVKNYTTRAALNLPPGIISLLLRNGFDPTDRTVTRGIAALGEEQLRTIYEEVVTKITDALGEVINEIIDNGIFPNYLFIVGGLGQSEILQQSIEARHGADFTQVVKPSFAGSQVLVGGAYTGKYPNLVRYKKSMATYGLLADVIYDPDVHEPDKVVFRNNNFVIPDVFVALLKRGDVIISGGSKSQRFDVAELVEQIEVSIYKSIKTERLSFNLDGCHLIHTITIPITQPRPNFVNVELKFLPSEINFIVTDENGNIREHNAKFEADHFIS